MFQALGIIETLGSIISHGTSTKFADVRTHLRKVSKMTLSTIWKKLENTNFVLSILLDTRPVRPSYKETRIGERRY